jgi:hypothetical protein
LLGGVDEVDPGVGVGGGGKEEYGGEGEAAHGATFQG